MCLRLNSQEEGGHSRENQSAIRRIALIDLDEAQQKNQPQNHESLITANARGSRLDTKNPPST